MASIAFATTGESAASVTFTVTVNPSFPRSTFHETPQLIAYRTADGTPYVEEVERAAFVTLTWPPSGLMTRANFASLVALWSATRGTQDRFTFTDELGDTHDAHFISGPEGWAEYAHGFAGSITLRVY